MSQSLDLPDPLYDALKRAAESSGTTPAGWIAAHLPGENDELASAGAGTMADLFAGHIGVIRSGHGTLSERCTEKFTDDLETRRREGRL